MRILAAVALVACGGNNPAQPDGAIDMAPDTGGGGACTKHSDCASGVCDTTTGMCAPGSDIAFASPTGGDTACTMADPCSLAKALALSPPRKFIELLPGIYDPGNSSVTQSEYIVGHGAQTTVEGGGFALAAGTTVTFDWFQITGAASGIDCTATGAPATLRAVHMVLQNNATAVNMANCNATLDRDNVVGSTNNGIVIDAGLVASSLNLTNSFVVRSSGFPLSIGGGNSVGGDVSFNTFVDNGSPPNCPSIASSANNIIVRNSAGTQTGCGTEVGGGTFANFHFVSPDTMPYDYHLGAGSTAIDAATGGTDDHDVDGEARPKGAARDLGADEAQ